jgi:hypothetical protein
MNENEIEFLQSADLNTCLLINGKICECYEDQAFLSLYIQTSVLVDCFQNFDPSSTMWLSLLLSTKEPFQYLSSSPLLLHPNNLLSESHFPLMTLVLPLTLDDLSRGLILLDSLRDVPNGYVYEFFIVTPDHENEIVLSSLSISCSKLQFPCRFLPESKLFLRHPTTWKQFGYATQMAIKLLISKFIKTSHYLTLDADHIFLHSPPLSHLFRWNEETQFFQSIYHYEEYYVHQPWWEGSKLLLKTPNIPQSKLSFGVTPALMSTWGAQMTLFLLTQAIAEDLLAEQTNQQLPMIRSLLRSQVLSREVEERIEQEWLESLGVNGRLWTEYTLYKIALEAIQVFDSLYFPEHGQCYLHCHNVWFREQLPWQYEVAARNASCLFSVVQSNTGLSSSDLYRQFLSFRSDRNNLHSIGIN